MGCTTLRTRPSASTFAWQQQVTEPYQFKWLVIVSLKVFWERSYLGICKLTRRYRLGRRSVRKKSCYCCDRLDFSGLNVQSGHCKFSSLYMESEQCHERKTPHWKGEQRVSHVPLVSRDSWAIKVDGGKVPSLGCTIWNESPFQIEAEGNKRERTISLVLISLLSYLLISW